MNQLLQSYSVRELYCDNNLSYILEDSSLFQTTEFKVLCHQHNSFFVETSKMMLNGKTQIFFFTGKYIPLSVLIKDYNFEDSCKLLLELYSSLLEIKKIGFLRLRNIIIGADRIFVDPSTNRIKWIYLPVSSGFNTNAAAAEKDMLCKIKSVIKSMLNEKNMEQIDELLDLDVTLDQTVAIFKNSTAISCEKSEHIEMHLQMKLQAVDTGEIFAISHKKKEFILGRKASVVDGLITSSNLIGRVHCKIVKNGNFFSVVDLQTINGTFVNDVRLRPYEMAPLSDGDILRLAKKEFRVTVEGRKNANS